MALTQQSLDMALQVFLSESLMDVMSLTELQLNVTSQVTLSMTLMGKMSSTHLQHVVSLPVISFDERFLSHSQSANSLQHPSYIVQMVFLQRHWTQL